MKFAKPFQGVPDGEIYPVQYQAGDECPAELEAAAAALGAFEVEDAETVTRTAKTKK
ncbi:hypothetical protein [Massilia sp. BHUDP2]|uniref:hypothetical protein n=1 Tax=Massilia sp. BHUDP2 TaxID=3034505 RepID=UPI0039058A6B